MKLHLKWYQVGPTCPFDLDSVLWHVPGPYELYIDNQQRTVKAMACPAQNLIPPITNGTICDLWFSYDTQTESCVTVIDSIFAPPFVQFVFWDEIAQQYVYFFPQFDSGQYHLSSMGWYWKQAYEDYAPSGLPDFDQKQDAWNRPMVVGWTFCGPTAVANCFWWFDSRHNVPARTPGDGFDQFPLVRDYEDNLTPWNALWWQDDHDMWNLNHLDTPWPPVVLPPPATPQPFVPGFQNPPILPPWGELVERLAWFMNTDDIQGTGSGHVGTKVPDMESAIEQWLLSETYENGSSLSDSLYENTIPQPTFAQIESLVKISEDVILLLGFWWPELPGPVQWWRVGGHYVTVAGVNSEDSSIAISDPFLDWAESGNSGRVLNGLYIPHSPPPHLATEHNDAGNISHDIYQAEPSPSPGGTWALPNYPASLDPWTWMVNFYNQNIPEEFIPFTQAWNETSSVFTEVEYAVVISPRPDFEIDAVPETLKLMQTELGSFYIDLTYIGGYFNPVSLNAEGMPAEVSWSFSDNPVVPPDTDSWLNLSASLMSPPGEYLLSIIGTDPIENSDTTSVVLMITPWHSPYMIDWIHSRYTVMAKTNFGQEGQIGIINPSFFWHDQEYLMGSYGGGSLIIGNDSINVALCYGNYQDFTPSESLKVDTTRVDRMLVEYGTAKYMHNLMPLEVTMISVGFMDSLYGGGEAILQEFIIENKFMWPSENIHFSLFLDWEVGEDSLNVGAFDSLYNYYYQYSTSPANEVLGVMRIPDKDTSILKGFLSIDNGIYIDPQGGWRKDSLWACMTRGTWDDSAGPTEVSALLTSQPFTLGGGEKHLESYWLFGYYMFGDKFTGSTGSADPFQRFLFRLLRLKGYYRGDVNSDGYINSADVVYLISYLFIGGPRPVPFADQGDVNLDGFVNSADVSYLINYLFVTGPQPIDYDRWLYYILMWRWGVPQVQALQVAAVLSTPPLPNSSLFCTRFRDLGHP